jgi:PAS domain S-box-containing protein
MTPTQERKHKGSILVIDDEPASLKLLFTILTEDGYAVHERQLDLESQLRFVKDTLPDLVLVDVRKRMEGYQLCASLKTDPTTRAVPVTFISSIDCSINQAKALVSSAVDYVTDPFDAEDVLWRIETHISLRRLRGYLESAARHVAQPVAPNEDLERAFQEIRVLTQVTGRKHAEERVRQAARELKEAQEALQSSERNLSLMISAIPTFIHVLRTDGSVLYVNQPVLDYTGLTLEDVRKEDYRARFFHPEDVERLREERREALTRAVPFENEQRVLGRDGRYRWFLIRYNPLLDEQGESIDDMWPRSTSRTENGRRKTCIAARRSSPEPNTLVQSAAFPGVWRQTTSRGQSSSIAFTKLRLASR